MALNKKLHRMGNASATNRDENMFRVFARICTRKNDFLPGTILQSVPVSEKTILSYLNEIAQAQTIPLNPYHQYYLNHLNLPFNQKIYHTLFQGEKQEQAIDTLHNLYKKLSNEQTQHYSTEKVGRLQQFVFEPNPVVPLETLYDRLNWSIITFKQLTTKPKKKV